MVLGTFFCFICSVLVIGITMFTLNSKLINQLRHRDPQSYGNIENGVAVSNVTPGSPSDR